MRKEVFSFPDRRDKKGCSQLCKRKPEELRTFDMDGLHEKLTPGLAHAQFLLGWLHIVDVGIASDLLGNLFFYLVHQKMEGNNLT